ncbi:MAG TPA: hypothetical protein VF326_15520 [Anaerolineaceae bacterium]|jgi:hypothetical protein
MCIFCAAIPVTVALGASAQHSQRERAISTNPKQRQIPVKQVAAVVIAGLVVGSMVTHTHLMGGI